MIRYKDIELQYSGKKIFSGFNLEVSENEKLLLAGPSGSGKTSLFRIILGFERVNAGKVFFGDSEITARNISYIRNNIFYLSQDIDFRNEKVASILEEIYSFEPNRGTVPGAGHQRQLMQMLDLGDEILQQNLQQLSGGERQRVGLLVCFMLNRPVWLLDEPTASLDDRLRQKVVAYILEAGKTVIIISHDDIWRKNKTLRVERWS